MLTFQFLILSTSFSLCSAGFAMETATTAAHDFAETDVSTPLQSLSLLQSLNTVNELVDVRAPQVHELKNHQHVRTLFVENPALPIVDIQLTFNAGSARDAEIEKGLFGVANMAAQLIDEGTKRYLRQRKLPQPLKPQAHVLVPRRTAICLWYG